MYVMTGGGPVRSSYTLVYFLYDSGFKYFDFGYASAIGLVLFVIVLIVSLVQRRSSGGTTDGERARTTAGARADRDPGRRHGVRSPA